MSYISLSCPLFFVVSNTLFITVVVKSEKEHPDLLVRELLLIQSICSSSYIGDENVYFITQKACSCKLHNNKALASSYFSSSSILSAHKCNCLDKEGKTAMRWWSYQISLVLLGENACHLNFTTSFRALIILRLLNSSLGIKAN